MPTITLSKKALLAEVKSKGDDWLKERIAFLGTDLEHMQGDDIHVEIFPSRPDMLSQQGFNRAFSSFVGQNTGLRQYKIHGNGGKVIIDKAVSSVRPFTACAIVKGLTLTDQLIKDIIQVQEKLHVTYGRNRKRCAIGIYPMEHITLPITYTAKKPSDIKFQPLESPKEMTGLQILSQHPTGRDYGHLLEDAKVYPLFMDAKGEVLSMPPIINSETTGRVSTSTTEVFIECSGFQYEVVHGALAMLVTALADMGGKIYEMTLEYSNEKKKSPQLEAWKMPFSAEYVKKYLGIELSDTELKKLLAQMGMGFEKKGKECVALVPAYRMDILHPIDIVEDLAIAYGTENVEAEIPQVATIAQEDPLEEFCNSLRDIFAGHGLLEVKNYNISNKDYQITDKLITVASSASSEYDTLRSRLLPSALSTLQRNKQYDYPQEFFEIGEVFWQDGAEETGVHEGKHSCVTLCGEMAGYTRVRQILDSLAESLGVEFSVKACEHSSFIPGRVGEVFLGKTKIGVIGEVHPELLSQFEIEMPVAVFELDVEKLL